MLKKITTTMMILGSLLATSAVNADEAKDLKIDKMVVFSDGSYNVSFNKKPKGTCSLLGFHFKIPADGDKKGLLFKLFNLALMTGKTVDIKYIPSSTPDDANQSLNKKCTSKTAAIIFGVGL